MDIHNLKVPAVTVAVVLIGTVGAALEIDARYAKTTDLEAMQTEAVLREQLAEKRANLYTATGKWADLVGREAMYAAKNDAGIITETDRNRWSEMQVAVRNAREEMTNIQSEIDELEVMQ